MFIDGQKIRNDILESLKLRVEEMKSKPKMNIVTVGDDFAMNSFVKIKSKFAEEIGVGFEQKKFNQSVTEDDLIEYIDSASKVSDGIVVQLPLPSHIDTAKVTSSIPRNLDIDLLSKQAYDRFLLDSKPKSIPPVAGSVWNILKFIKSQAKHELKDKNVVIVGNGYLTGKPVYDLLKKNKFSNLQIIDIDTEKELYLKSILNADILISGTGVPSLIKKEMIKDEVILIDMGSSSDKGVLVGDIDLKCSEKASYLSKTPGGVGPGTVAVLFENLVNNYHE